MSEHVWLEPVDAVDVTILVDNSIDLLMLGSETVRRAPLAYDWSERGNLSRSTDTRCWLPFTREAASRPCFTMRGWAARRRYTTWTCWA